MLWLFVVCEASASAISSVDSATAKDQVCKREVGLPEIRHSTPERDLIIDGEGLQNSKHGVLQGTHCEADHGDESN